MSSKPINDAAFALNTEALDLKLKFKHGVPSKYQATVEWNIPSPAHGCNSDIDLAYAGIVVVISDKPITENERPEDGKVYVADPTADFNLSTADKIGNAYVIGAFYECDKKYNDEEFTTSFIVNDLKKNGKYYVAAFIVDCEYRYHKEGIRAYSDEYGESNENNKTGYQVVIFSDDTTTVKPSDATNLDPTKTYKFDIVLDDTYPKGDGVKVIEFDLLGSEIPLYSSLFDIINYRFKTVDNPIESATPPNANTIYVPAEQKKVLMFNGTTFVELPALFEPTDPSDVQMGTYWYNITDKTLKRWNIPTPNGWNDVSLFESTIDLANPTSDLYWFDGTKSYRWNGTTWCEKETYVSDTPPTDCPTLTAGWYWYDSKNSYLYQWNPDLNKWDNIVALYWKEAPNALSDGTYWFDTSNAVLKIRNSGTWNERTDNIYIQETQPTVAIDGTLWYKPSTEQLFSYHQFSPVGWVEEDVIVWPVDPTDTKSCNFWWNSIDDNLYIYDSVHDEWDLAQNFVKSDNDPSQPQPINVDSVWFNPTTKTMYSWDGGDWNVVIHVEKTTDPTFINDGETWYKIDTDEWFVWNIPNAGWNSINPIDAPFDPNSIPVGTYWYDETNDLLYIRDVSGWNPISFVTTDPTPARNTLWYDTTTTELKRWDGEEWIIEEPRAKAYFDDNDSLIIETTKAGSENIIFIPVPEGYPNNISSCSYTTGYAYHGVYDIAGADCLVAFDKVQKVYTVRPIELGDFLFANLNPQATILQPSPGNDGVPRVPVYNQIGVGTDGTSDERRELIESIRAQLGYPVVDVELTNYQFDTAIQNALETFRQRSTASTRREFYFLDIEPKKQSYVLTNKAMGYHKIVNITAIYRFTSAFLSSAHGAGLYGQIVLQHLYNMGTYDLTSFHLVSQYVEQLEHLFATRLTFAWHEHSRTLHINNAFSRPERVLMDTMIERTEQDLMKDRITKRWIERWALSEAMLMLSQIRGKYASLPGAGGGISLNAADLYNQAMAIREELLQDLETYVADTPEDIGMHSTFILG